MSRVAQPRALPITKRDARPGTSGSADLVQDGELLPSRLHRMTLLPTPPSSSSSSASSSTTRQPFSSTVANALPPSEICPVCKSSRYLNASLRFLVNPECYHKMCESCVDRIFSHGPAQCPIQGCRHTLRKARFRQQTFDDITVEREVDIRRRVAAVFDRREDDFETLRDYNDYLNDAEDITFNLIHNIDPSETQRRLALYKEVRERENVDDPDAAKSVHREGAEAAARKDAPRRVDGAAGGVTLKKRMNRAAAAERAQGLQSFGDREGQESGAGDGGLVIKGLKARVRAEPEKAIDPFGGLDLGARRYFVPQGDYVWNVLQDARTDPLINAGGYDVRGFSSRAIGEAFAGFGVCVAEEMAERESGGGARMGAQDSLMVDVF